MDSATSSISVESSYKKKVGRTSKSVTFARPPFASEAFSEENKKAFDKLPGYARHFVQQFIRTGNLKLAASQANISKEIDNTVDTRLAEDKKVSDFLDSHGMTSEEIATYLSDCLKAEVLVRDKHGNLHQTIDMKVRLQTIELLLKLKGELGLKAQGPKSLPGAVDLFGDLDPTKSE